MIPKKCMFLCAIVLFCMLNNKEVNGTYFLNILL